MTANIPQDDTWISNEPGRAHFATGKYILYVELVIVEDVGSDGILFWPRLHEMNRNEINVLHMGKGPMSDVDTSVTNGVANSIFEPTEDMNLFFKAYPQIFDGLSGVEGFKEASEAIEYMNALCVAYQIPVNSEIDISPVRVVGD